MPNVRPEGGPKNVNKFRIACDVNISNRDIGELARDGFVIVCVAAPGEDDESWLERALGQDVDVIISQDLDIPNLLDRWRVEDDVLWFETIYQFRRWRDRRGHYGKREGRKNKFR